MLQKICVQFASIETRCTPHTMRGTSQSRLLLGFNIGLVDLISERWLWDGVLEWPDGFCLVNIMYTLVQYAWATARRNSTNCITLAKARSVQRISISWFEHSLGSNPSRLPAPPISEFYSHTPLDHVIITYFCPSWAVADGLLLFLDSGFWLLFNTNSRKHQNWFVVIPLYTLIIIKSQCPQPSTS